MPLDPVIAPHYVSMAPHAADRGHHDRLQIAIEQPKRSLCCVFNSGLNGLIKPGNPASQQSARCSNTIDNISAVVFGNIEHSLK